MKFTIHKNEINGMLKRLAGAMRGKPSSPKMAFIALGAKNGKLTLVAASAGVGMSVTTEKIDVLEEGGCAVAMSVFAKFMAAQKDGDITIECEDPNEGKMKITVGHSSTSIHCAPVEASPLEDATPFLVAPEDKKVSNPMLRGTELAEAMRGAWSAINKNPSPEIPIQYLNVSFEVTVDGVCRFVATDMKRLSVTNVRSLEEYHDPWEQHVIPSEAFFGLMTVLQQSGESESVVLLFDSKRMLAVGDEWQFGFSFCSNDFANYHPLLDMDSFDGEVTIDRLVFETALRRILPVAPLNLGQPVVIDLFEDGRCMLSTSSVEYGEGRDEFDFPAPGPVKRLRAEVNGHFLLEGVTAIEKDAMKIRYCDETTPLHLFFGDAFHYILMPIKTE